MKNKKEKKYNFIYKTTCIITGRYYIGMHSTNNIEDGYMGSGKRLWNSIKYHGKDKHSIEVLKYFNNREELVESEKEIVNELLLEDNLCMNLVIGGQGGYISEYGVKKGREKCDNILREKYGDDFRSIIMKDYYENLSLEDKEVISYKIKKGQKLSNFNHATFKDRKHSPESKLKIGEANSIKQKGEGNSQYGTCWIKKDGENKKIKKDDIDIYLSNGWVKGRV